MPSSSVKRKTQNVHRWSSRRAPFYVLRLTFYVSRILAVVVEDPAATVAVDDHAAGLQDLHGGGPDLDMARGAGIADDAHDRESSLFLDQTAKLGELAGPHPGLDLADLSLRLPELFVDHALRGAPVFHLLFVFLGFPGGILFPLLQVLARGLELLFEPEHLVLARADLLLDTVHLVQDGAVLAAGLHVAELRLVFLLFFLLVGELRGGAPVLHLGFQQALLQPLDRLELLPEGAGHLGQLRRDGVALPLAALDEPDSLLEAVQLVQEAAHSAAPAYEKGCPGHGTPSKVLVRVFSSVSNLAPQAPGTPDSLKAYRPSRAGPAPHLWWVHSDSNRGLTGYEPVALDR